MYFRHHHPSGGSMENLHDQIAKKAYELFQARGGVDGYHITDWLQAEKEILAPVAKKTRAVKKSAPRKAAAPKTAKPKTAARKKSAAKK
jgi:hypothetical protein